MRALNACGGAPPMPRGIVLADRGLQMQCTEAATTQLSGAGQSDHGFAWQW